MALAWVCILLFLPLVVPEWIAKEVYNANNCSGTPVVVNFIQGTRCLSRQCLSVEINNATQYVHDVCNITDGFAYASELFSEKNSIVIEDYASTGCENLLAARVLPATGICTQASVFGSYSIISVLFSNGSASIRLFADRNCEGKAYLNLVLGSGRVSNGDCVENYYKFYTRAIDSVLRHGEDVVTNSGSGPPVRTDSNRSSRGSEGHTAINTTALIAVIVTATLFGFATAIFVWKRRAFRVELKSEDLDGDASCASYTPLPDRQTSAIFNTKTRSSSSMDERQQRSISCFWKDAEIAAARIDRDKIRYDQVICQGGFGQVMSGWFNDQHVAIKMLLPEHRKSLKFLNSFLQEVKLMMRLEHPRIVEFVGVAWDSLSDLCLLTTFMEGGDLRSLLASYESQNQPIGFNETKVTIALHVAHALTYLHSLDPPVLHRDLKSRNILLSAKLEARLSDFGVSCVNADTTMTAGVGTSLWMAPEVMLGERYGNKADVFSLGVVLSELDLHTLPYSLVTDKTDPSRKIPSTAIAHLVAMGQLRIKFSSADSMAKLGLSCVAVDPNDRPTAAEVLFQLHTVLTTEYGRRDT